MRVAVDGMGGDRAPEQVVLGAARAAEELGTQVIVVGEPDRLRPLLEPHPGLKFAAASQTIAMSEAPAQAVRSKPDSSMAVCARMCREGQADAWVSAGNSGAVVATALLVQGRIRGVSRPALGTVLPSARQPTYLLDVGANVDSKPEFLVQFARMAAVYAEQVMGRTAPRVGLLANGEEDSKGDGLVREVHRRLRQEPSLNFVGNIEPKELLAGGADVVVADGFAGNLTIKMGEATVELILRVLKEEIPRSLAGKLGGLLIRGGVGRVKRQIDWREYGGAPLLGIQGVAVVAHGRSDATAVRNAIRSAEQALETGLAGKIQEAIR